MKRALIALLLTSGAAWGQSVKVPAEIRCEPREWVFLTAEVDGGPARYFLPDKGLEEVNLESLFGSEVAEKAKGRIFKAKAPGRFRVWVVTSKPRKDNPSISDVSDKAECLVIVGESPEPPVPPGPTPPGPQPPGPTPGPAPIPGDGLRVLIVVETSDASKLPRAQLNILTATSIREYLNAKCAKDEHGTPAYRFWDKDIPLQFAPASWQAAMKLERKSLPWIIVSNPQKGGGFQGPLPATVDETLALIRKYGD